MSVGNRSPNTTQIQYEVLESKMDRVVLLVSREDNQYLPRIDQLHAIPYMYSIFQSYDLLVCAEFCGICLKVLAKDLKESPKKKKSSNFPAEGCPHPPSTQLREGCI